MKDELVKQLAELLAAHPIKSAALFGSYARGEETPESDIDLLVEYSKPLSLFGIAGIQIDLEDKLDKKVDLVEKGCLKPKIKPYVEHDLIPIV